MFYSLWLLDHIKNSNSNKETFTEMFQRKCLGFLGPVHTELLAIAMQKIRWGIGRIPILSDVR